MMMNLICSLKTKIQNKRIRKRKLLQKSILRLCLTKQLISKLFSKKSHQMLTLTLNLRIRMKNFKIQSMIWKTLILRLLKSQRKLKRFLRRSILLSRVLWLKTKIHLISLMRLMQMMLLNPLIVEIIQKLLPLILRMMSLWYLRRILTTMIIKFRAGNLNKNKIVIIKSTRKDN